MKARLLRLTAQATLLATALACGGSDGEPAATFLEHPWATAAIEGGTARFQVHASGTRGLEYQWRKDGVDLPGATDSHYVTPALGAADDGAVFTVVVTNVGGPPAESHGARLTVYPPVDLRFKWVGAPFVPPPTANHVFEVQRGGMLEFILAYDQTGTPLPVGPGVCGETWCSWGFVTEAAPGMNASYWERLLSDLAPDWATALPASAVVLSMDLEEGPGFAALSYQETTQPGAFTPVVQASAPPDQLQAIATAEGTAGRVITAVSFLGGQVSYVSHGWTRAASATYDARVVVAPDLPGAGDAARALAVEGYVITAFGAGNRGVNGFVLVGTRLTGQSAPRDVLVTNDVSQVYGAYPVVGSVVGAALGEGFVVGER